MESPCCSVYYILSTMTMTRWLNQTQTLLLILLWDGLVQQPGCEFQFAEQDRNLLVSEARYLLVSEARGMSFIALSRNTIHDIDKAQSLLMEIVIINYKAHTGLWSLRRQHFRKYFTRTNKFYLVFCMTYLVIIVFGEEQNEWWEIVNQIFQSFFHRFH